MADALIHFAVSNLCLSLVVALAAWLVHRSGRLAGVAHLLWVLVLVKLVTPPVVTLPLIALPGGGEASGLVAALAVGGTDVAGVGPSLGAGAGSGVVSAPGGGGGMSVSGWVIAKRVLLGAWVVGSVALVAVTLVRVWRFNRTLRRASRPASAGMRCLAADVASRLGVRRVPVVLTTSARVSPMVWWVGGRVRVILPEALLSVASERDVRWVVAHEMAHVRRLDHLVRWLEWLACVLFWWNPVSWWARRNLRLNEEICCDALVLSRLGGNSRAYASALLAVVEFLAAPVLRPPGLASEIGSGGSLERRFSMIVSKDRMRMTPRWVHAGILVSALGLLPLGVAYAQEPDYDAIGLRLREAVGAGELTPEQARAMLRSLREREGVGEAAVSGEEGGPVGNARARAYLREIEAQFHEAVESGRVSREDAARRLDEARRAVERRLADGERAAREADVKREHERLAARLRERVAAGDLTKVEAADRLHAAREAIGRRVRERGEGADHRDEGGLPERHLAEMRRRLADAIASGDVSEVEAARMMEAFREEMSKRAAGQERERAAGLERRREITEAVKSGRMTREEARRAFEAMDRRMAEVRGQAGRRGKEGKTGKEKAERAASVGEDAWKARAGRIEAAVKKGELTREEADAKLRSLRARAAKALDKEEGATAGETYWRTAAEMWRAVAEGKAEASDVERRLAELKRSLSPGR